MGRNVEVKARVDSLERLRERVVALADSGPEVIEQEDTFFRAGRGRLKLRAFRDGSGELIFYQRPDQAGPKTSVYRTAQVENCEALKRVLHQALGTCGVVCKKRELFMLGRTRIHLDEVEGLGDFFELEVVLGGEETVEEGRREARRLLQRLGVREDKLVEKSYLDLLGRK